jgi:hypothetical protein
VKSRSLDRLQLLAKLRVTVLSAKRRGLGVLAFDQRVDLFFVVVVVR